MSAPIPSLLNENLGAGVPTQSALSWGKELWQMPALLFRPRALSYGCFALCLSQGTSEPQGSSALRDRWVSWRLGSVSGVRGQEGCCRQCPPAISNYQEARDYLPETSQLGARPPGKQLEKLRHWTCSLTPFRQKVGDGHYSRNVIGPGSQESLQSHLKLFCSPEI